MRIELSGRASRRGSVLVHVMMTCIVVALIAATLLRMALLRYRMGARGAAMLAEKRGDQAALASVMTYWNTVNAVCANPPVGVSNYTCLPNYGATPAPPGTCNCTCTPVSQTTPATLPSVVAANVGGNCQLSMVSPDLP